MITSFKIENFRLFNEIEIKKCNRVNLFVGKNNSGKTALLEALYIFLGNADSGILLGLIEKREEYWDSDNTSATQEDVESFLRHFFKGHSIPFLGEKGISFEAMLSSQDKEMLTLSTCAVIEKSKGDNFTRELVKKIEDENNVAHYVIAVERNGKIIDEVNLDINAFQYKQLRAKSRLFRNRKSSLNIKPRNIINYVSTEGIDKEGLARLWDSISLTDLENEVVSGLQILEPRIEGVVFVKSEALRSRIPLVKMRGEKERLPMKSMGDGVFRLFYIILSLVNSKDGYLLVDEFENGIHWSVQKQLWAIVFQLSKKLNIQVFATTHSRDCIISYRDCWEGVSEESASFYRVNNETDSFRIRRYDFDLLDDSMDTNIEVR